MIRTEQHTTTGIFITLQHDNITLTIRTEHGTDSELAEEAADMRKKAARLERNADLIKLAIHGYQ